MSENEPIFYPARNGFCGECKWLTPDGDCPLMENTACHLVKLCTYFEQYQYGKEKAHGDS